MKATNKTICGATLTHPRQRVFPLFACLFVTTLGGLAHNVTNTSGSEQVKAFKKFIESPPIIKSLKARVETRGVSFLFVAGDIIDVKSFAAKLNQPAPADQLSQYLRTNLSTGAQQILASTNATRNEPALRQCLVAELNQIIQTQRIYDSNRFAGVSLSPESVALLEKSLVGPQLIRFNRRLLLDAYANELSSTNHPSKTEAFVELRYQTNAFFVKTATSMDGLLADYVKPLTASEVARGVPPTHSMAAGWYGSNCWTIANGILQTDSLSHQLSTVYSLSNRNPAILQAPLFLATRLMNLGLPSEKMASLEWSGDSVTGTDHFGATFTAQLQPSARGEPAGFKLVFTNHPFAQGPSHRRELSASYERDRQIPGWVLPTCIRIDGTNWRAEILSVELGRKPLSPRHFDYKRFLNLRSRLLFIVTRRNEKEIAHIRYDDLQHGMRNLAGISFHKRTLRSGAYLLFFGLTASVVAVGSSFEKRKQEKTTKHKRNKDERN